MEDIGKNSEDREVVEEITSVIKKKKKIVIVNQWPLRLKQNTVTKKIISKNNPVKVLRVGQESQL